MKNFILVLAVLTFASITSSALSADEIDDGNAQLKLVHVVFRHGDRNPIDLYPSFEHKDESFWPEGFAQLTRRGKMQQYELGKYLKQRYQEFLNASYSPYEIYVRSSNVDRTIASAEANLAGMYPPNDNISIWNPQLPWQPIPVHAQPADGDNMIRMNGKCPKFDELNADFLNSEVVKELRQKYAHIFELLSNKTEQKVHNPDDVDYIYDAIYIQNLYYHIWPAWATPEVLDAMHNITAFSFKALSYTKEMQRLRGGPLLKDIVKNMRERISGSLDKRRKLFVYSGHDTTLAILLNTMGVFDEQIPPYASSIMIELVESKLPEGNSTHFVKIWWRNNTAEPYLLTVPGCTSLCPYDQFHMLMKHNIPEDWESECQDYVLYKDFVKVTVAGILILSLMALILSAGFMCVKLFQSRRKSPPAYPYLHLQMEDEDA